jgi:hypothetical protein
MLSALSRVEQVVVDDRAYVESRRSDGTDSLCMRT